MNDPKELVSYQQLQSARQWIWGWITFLFIYLVVWQWPSLTMNAPQHSYLVSIPSAGSLISDWWSWEHFTGLFLLLLWIVPFSLAFASDSPLTTWRRTLHLVMTFLLFLVMLALLFWWSVKYEAANDPSAANAENPANDPRWCCVNFALAPQRCVPISAANLCNPGPGQADLVTAPMFVYRFWFLVVFLLVMILDFFVIVKGVLERAVNRYHRDVTGEGAAADNDEENQGVFRFRVPVPSAPSAEEINGDPPRYNAKGEPYCVKQPAPSLSMKDQLRATAARQQQLLVQQAKGASGVGRYNGKNSKR